MHSYRMTTLIHSEGGKEFAQATDKTLVSTGAFNGEFYSYTVAMNSRFQMIGTFTIVPGATSTTCPAGRVLHLTGKKLFPDINPMNTFVAGSPLTAKKFLVAVYDPVSFLNGFIDPTSTTFAKFDQNVPNFFNTGRDGSGIEWSAGGQAAELRLVDATMTAAVGGGVTFEAGNASVGRVWCNTYNTHILVRTTAFTANSRVLLSCLSGGNALQFVTAADGSTTFTPGSFRINFTNASAQVNFMIIN
jgi:hypothetical protein